ncbi:DUF3343 domain-containing protein [Hafnia paralvei]|uniref:DUF3343 domain-containing protein n=1 Tax=Hafnia paralvei TaxID=546367 RepID=A0A4Q9ESS6_9GAMM|nr:DUF3343 domain-containing protein [Hafnia paralvei]TBM28781.1 DUF3343 domain-containing protein [Hafnia paralvei]
MQDEFLFLFHSTLGVVRLKKRLQAQNREFKVADIPRQLSSGCGLSIRLSCTASELALWWVNGETSAIFRCAEGEYVPVSPPSFGQ